jgi:hypothetical protein
MTSWYRDYNPKNDSGVNTAGKSEENSRNPASRRPNHRFDFEVGYLVNSPCRSCEQRDDFPGCDDKCETLEKIHSILRDSVSCSKHG